MGKKKASVSVHRGGREFLSLRLVLGICGSPPVPPGGAHECRTRTKGDSPESVKDFPVCETGGGRDMQQAEKCRGKVALELTWVGILALPVHDHVSLGGYLSRSFFICPMEIITEQSRIAGRSERGATATATQNKQWLWLSQVSERLPCPRRRCHHHRIHSYAVATPRGLLPPRVSPGRPLNNLLGRSS